MYYQQCQIDNYKSCAYDFSDFSRVAIRDFNHLRRKKDLNVPMTVEPGIQIQGTFMRVDSIIEGMLAE